MSKAAKNQGTDEHNATLLGTPEESLGTPKNICGWTIRKTKRGYYEGVRRAGGKLVSKHIGRDLSRAHEILSAELPSTTTLQSGQAGEIIQAQADRVAGPEVEAVSKPEAPQLKNVPCRGEMWCKVGKWCVHRRECWGTR